MCEQVQQRSEGEYDVRLCVEEAGLIVARQTTPATICHVTLTSPILRDHLNIASPGVTDLLHKLSYFNNFKKHLKSRLSEFHLSNVKLLMLSAFEAARVAYCAMYNFSLCCLQ